MRISIDIRDSEELLFEVIRNMPRSLVLQLIKNIDKEIMEDWDFTTELYLYFKGEMDKLEREKDEEIVETLLEKQRKGEI